MTNINDAKLLLKSWGAQNPLIINALKVKEQNIVIISNDDADKIYNATKKNNFLKEGKVVFLIGD